ncbi:2-haloalkanoic acid dehalogenase [Aureimonas sp. Leaf454]|uniref:HAD family hydrolase n=1 Tax=Aureimonas sp. Leaf454 TaxID=1736381 RepID=UPI0006F2847D|nr:HAD family phosphatase [Aureimonas sp. Leaf454]KQT54686.1 2-haloalkanoic acid dehalogenase [Aureimonas sp. Leaf454]
MIDHIVFDIGRVLIHYDPEIPFRRLIPDEAERTRFLSEVCTPDWNLEQDRGRRWSEAERALIADHPDHEEHIRAFHRHWHEMVPHHHAEPVAHLRRLVAEGRDVTLLTNFSVETYALARRLFPFLDETRGATVSGEIGVLKPDRAIYTRHATRFGLRPDRTLFLDDSARNVEGARDAGWQAWLIEEPGDVTRALRAVGLCD